MRLQGEEQPGDGAAEVQPLGDFDEGPQLRQIQLHGLSLADNRGLSSRPEKAVGRGGPVAVSLVAWNPSTVPAALQPPP
jgi:hypothetical protein